MLDIELVKQHCRIEKDFKEDDNLLVLYTNAAVSFVEQSTGRTVYLTEHADGYADDPDGLKLTDNIKAALLLLIAFWYENREPISIGDVMPMPFSVDALIQPYRIYGL